MTCCRKDAQDRVDWKTCTCENGLTRALRKDFQGVVESAQIHAVSSELKLVIYKIMRIINTRLSELIKRILTLERPTMKAFHRSQSFAALNCTQTKHITGQPNR